MSYIKCYQGQKLDTNYFEMHLWEDDGKHQIIPYKNSAYVTCPEGKHTHRGLNGEYLKSTTDWYFSKNPKYADKSTRGLHFHDMPPYQKFLIDRYGTNDEPSKNHKEIFFDIEIEMGGALTEEYIQSAPKPVTSIAWWYKQKDEWVILILDEKKQLKHTKAKNKEIVPFNTEKELLKNFISRMKEISPDILIGWNSDYFDIPYLYYRICNILNKKTASYLSPLGEINSKKDSWYKDPITEVYKSKWYTKDQFVNIVGVESLDYMRLHKKYSFRDEPSFKLDVIGEKYAGINKIEYEGSLDRLFEEDIYKFIQYNFRDVEILKALDEKLEYLALTKNLAHKGKHNYSEVYANTKTQDGAISAYLLSQGIAPPAKDANPISKKNYAGGYLFCPTAGIFKYMFDEDLTSLYPSIIMSLNIGKETLAGRIIMEDEKVVVENKEIFNCHYALNDLEKMDPNDTLLFEFPDRKREYLKIKDIIKTIKIKKYAISANGVVYKTDRESVLSTILNTWFQERKDYKAKMKKAYQSGDKESGEKFHLLQYTMKILLNSLYGATALGSFRYGNVILSESITLTGQRIIQESALFANRNMNKEIKGE
jgi:DNA polymerase elongation subunit (family B)